MLNLFQVPTLYMNGSFELVKQIEVRFNFIFFKKCSTFSLRSLRMIYLRGAQQILNELSCRTFQEFETNSLMFRSVKMSKEISIMLVINSLHSRFN